MFRVGTGFDIHRLVPGRRLVLCGVEFAFPFGLFGHSDADAPTHALMDALLGAAALGDIGHLFPDTDDRWKDVDSTELLAAVLDLPEYRTWTVVNADITIALQAPKLAPYIDAMRERLSEVMGISPARVSIKATTTEHLGFVGRKEGCEVWAIVLITRK